MAEKGLTKRDLEQLFKGFEKRQDEKFKTLEKKLVEQFHIISEGLIDQIKLLAEGHAGIIDRKLGSNLYL
jgi:RecB family exonuclease